MGYDEALAERVRSRLPGTTPQRMFGGLTFLSGRTIAAGVYGDELLIRVDPEEMETVLTAEGARPFLMRGKPTKGFVLVDGGMLDDRRLDTWIARARTYVDTT